MCKAELPVIVFGDHAKCLKFIDFPFALGADGVKVLRPKINANPKYLYYVLKSLRITDAGYSRHFKFLRRNEIPLPPLEHQRRIAEVIDRADTLRQRRLLAIQKLNTLLRSVFLDMFGDPVTNPKGWPTSNLESFGEFIGGGTPRRDVQSFYTGSICWATSKDMKGREEQNPHALSACISGKGPSLFWTRPKRLGLT
ncbi:MAG: restriction endonuclease subunit S [Chloracidobacterium sp.]|nr:restriction endonuclease subunit S [Chloracidobacterium sp.]